VSNYLVGQIPRGFADHRSRYGRIYAEYLRDLLARLGPLPPSAKPTLREVGRLAVDMYRLREEQDAAMARRRLTVARKVDRRLTPIRSQLIALEQRLEALATAQPPRDLASVVTQVHRARGR
jgi:hypothetical protein